MSKWEPLKLLGGNLDYQYCKDKEVLLEGGRGTGKSVAALHKIHLLLATYPKARALVVRRTRRSITQSTIPTFENKILEPMSELTRFLLSKGGHKRYRMAYNYPNGSEIEFGSMENPDDFKSADYDLVVFEEAEQERSIENYLTLVHCLRNNVLPYQQITCVCNPGSPSHWLNVRGSEIYSDNTKVMTRIKTTLKNNPLFFNIEKNKYTEAGLDYLKPFESFPKFLRQRYLDGQWTAAEGGIYTEVWDENKHIIKPFDTIGKEYRHIMSIDWGTVHTGVIQVWAINKDKIMYLVEEVVTPGKDVEWWFNTAQDLINKYNIDEVVADSANKGNRLYFQRRGINTKSAIKNPVKDGISAVYARLKGHDGIPNLYIFKNSLKHKIPDVLLQHHLPTCLAEELNQYVWKIDKQGNTLEEPVKMNDDGCDALRYAVAHIDTQHKFCFVMSGDSDNNIIEPEITYEMPSVQERLSAFLAED